MNIHHLYVNFLSGVRVLVCFGLKFKLLVCDVSSLIYLCVHVLSYSMTKTGNLV